MTHRLTMSGELDPLDQLGAKAFAGFVVRKQLIRQYSRLDLVTTETVEFLLGRSCTVPAKIEEGLQFVEKQLQGHDAFHRKGGAVPGPLP